mmetsp:Transcript_83318/g.165398  ORF Transcript_83318/g.165398 Transcript_83318/m.165398 type:complete len:616 (-) Transcript_83318:69-1916(-)|eukprot:CAMPEP_0172808366 /NCGR_PEP_ID=MMETSP1075-20121228/7642_1 /TAXON_ID=2916 /ORGANISM="Ceratium fusus, Strain PA161109" /LENGTH=615 /DNA_ID=CAMNT_0013647513 /DNA_START=56 /DNA_END=1903 /DNA_ORIENTATION=+
MRWSLVPWIVAVLAGHLAKGQRLRVANACTREPIWVAHMASTKSGPDKQNIFLKPGESFVFNTHKIAGTRYWPKARCNAHGNDCELGESGGPDETCNNTIGCAPPVDTKFEASFEQNGVDWVDVSLVDGWTLPFKFEMSNRCNAGDGHRGINRIVDCSHLSFEACPQAEPVGNATANPVNLQVVHPSTGNIVGCYAPCSKLTFSNWNNAAARYAPPDPEVQEYCCPTPPESPQACRKGPVGRTQFVQAVHRDCPGVYGYSYDDGMGLILCPDDTHYKMTFYCPKVIKSNGNATVPSAAGTTHTTTNAQGARGNCQMPIWSVRSDPKEASANTTFRIVHHTKDGWEQYVSLQTSTGRFLAAEPDGFVTADIKTASFWELFTMDTYGDGRVSFRSFHGRYLTAEPYGSLRSLGWTAGDRQKFRVAPTKNGTVALQCFDGRYITTTTACKSEVGQVLGTCYEKDTAYSPLDMPGEGQTREDEASSCQARCRATRGCAYFTYFVVGGYCHVTNGHALQMLGSLGAISGPSECQGSDFIMKDARTRHGGVMPQGSLGGGGMLILLLVAFSCPALMVHGRCRGASRFSACGLFRTHVRDQVSVYDLVDQEATSALICVDSS